MNCKECGLTSASVVFIYRLLATYLLLYQHVEVIEIITLFCNAVPTPDRTGFLNKRGEKSPGFKQRWFVLKGNLLFYAKSPTDKEPIGFILLENIHAYPVSEPGANHAFALSFGSQATRTYVLSAQNAVDLRDWIAAIEMSSVYALRSRMEAMDKRILELETLLPIGHPASVKADHSRVRLQSEPTRVAPLTKQRSASNAMPPASHLPAPVPPTRRPRPSSQVQDRPSSQLLRRSSLIDSVSESSSSLPQQESSVSVDSVSGPSSTGSSPTGSPTLNRSTMSNAPRSTEFMELAIGCTHLQLPPYTPVTPRTDSSSNGSDESLAALPNPFVVVSLLQNGSWTELSKTEVIENMSETEFMFEPMFDKSDVTSGGEIRLDVMHQVSFESDSSVLIGMVTVRLADLAAASPDPVTVELVNPAFSNMQPGSIILTASLSWTSSHQQLSHRLDGAVTSESIISGSSSGFHCAPVPVDSHPLTESSSLASNRSATSNPSVTSTPIAKSRKEPSSFSLDSFEHLVSTMSTSQNTFGLGYGLSPAPSLSPIAVKTYRLVTTSDQRLKVSEEMIETPFSFTVPHALLRLLVIEDKRRINDLESLQKLSSDTLDQLRLQTLRQYQERVNYYQANMKKLIEYTGPSFKPSTKKKSKDLEFVPINLHIQRIHVCEATCRVCIYELVTVGAFAAHSLGFKKGGLQRLYPTEAGGDLPITYSKLDTLQLKLEACVRLLANVAQLIAQPKYDPQTEMSVFKQVQHAGSQLGACARDLVSVLESPAIGNAAAIAMEALDAAGGKPPLDANRVKILFTDRMVSRLRTMLDNLVATLAISGCTADDICGASLKLAEEAVGRVKDVRKYVQLAMLKDPEPSEKGLRQDIVFSQALCALLTSLMSRIQLEEMTPHFLSQIQECGFLFDVSSLLSTFGDEMGMLEDIVVGVDLLQRVRISIVADAEALDDPHSNASPIGSPIGPMRLWLSGGRGELLVSILVTPTLFASMLDHRRTIAVVPVIFTQGINEAQTLSNWTNSDAASIQDAVNIQSLRMVENYVRNYRRFANGINILLPVPEREDSSESLLAKLDESIRSKKAKNTSILQISEDLVRKLNGGRCSSCKSAKDRTSMAVTLEQVNILQQSHSLKQSQFSQALDAMRSRGTRRDNVLKNTGQLNYGFNTIQYMTLPKLYRPPRNTIGSSST